MPQDASRNFPHFYSYLRRSPDFFEASEQKRDAATFSTRLEIEKLIFFFFFRMGEDSQDSAAWRLDLFY